MRIVRVQFIHMPPFIGGQLSNRYLEADPKRGVRSIEHRPPFVCLTLVNGQEMLLPEESLYITVDPDEGTVDESHGDEAKPKRKHRRTRPLEGESFSPLTEVID